MAIDEGEGDRSLAYWRRAHTDYFTRRGEFQPGMEVYCERFRLVEVIEGDVRTGAIEEIVIGRRSRQLLPAGSTLYPSTNSVRAIPCA